MGLVYARWKEGSMGNPKQCTGKQKWSCNDLILVLWPGKFPRTSCFSKIVKNECERLQMGAYGLTLVRIQYNKGDKSKLLISAYLQGVVKESYYGRGGQKGCVRAYNIPV
jgi:hypothetical protein